jgi:hypothetical protein
LVPKSGPQIKTKLGELVQIQLNTGESIRGCVSERVQNGVRLSEAYITEDTPESADRDDLWVPCFVMIEIPYSKMESLRIISLGP